MTTSNANEAALDLIKSLQAANKAVADTAATTQERNLAFVQTVLESGIEVLKSNADGARSLIQELASQTNSQQTSERLQTLIDSTLAAQERNNQFAQQVFESAIEALKSQVGITRTLMEELGQQGQQQQNAFQVLAQQSVDAYMSLWRAPFTYYQQALDAAEVATRQSIERFQTATRQGLDYMQALTQQARATAKNSPK
jgi:polyhydroxyalkanoate synthesis regulator phasin